MLGIQNSQFKIFELKPLKPPSKSILRFIDLAVEFRFCGMILVTGPLRRFVSIPSLPVRGERSFGSRFLGLTFGVWKT